MAWLYVRVDEMKKALEQTQTDVAALRSGLAGAQSDLAQARSNIAGVNSGVAYATSLAENANRYAHSHNSYSDARLKTDVADIPNALDGVPALHGVSYRWNTTGFPAMLLDDGPQLALSLRKSSDFIRNSSRLPRTAIRPSTTTD